MSAKPVGRALFFAAANILLILALPAVRAGYAPAPGGAGQTRRPPAADPPSAPADISHSQQTQLESGGRSMPPPPGQRDPYAYLPILARPSACDLNEEEQAIADLATNHPEQERETMSCHPILAQVARAHAVDMATRNYYSEINPEGFGPNARVEQAGYELPDSYTAVNNIESIIVGYDTPEGAWNSWLDGNGHEEHVLGESNFKDQTNYGVGYAFSADSMYRHYWVFTTAPPPPQN
jgi:hypothetical protein